MGKPCKTPFRIRRSFSSGKWYVLGNCVGRRFGGDFLSVGHNSVDIAINWLKDYLKPKINGSNAL